MPWFLAVALLLVVGLLAVQARRYYERLALVSQEAERLLRLLDGSPRLEGAFGFESYRGSALQSVDRLRDGVNKLALDLATLVQGQSATLTRIDEKLAQFDVSERRLRADNERFRDGFLAAHDGVVFGRVIQVLDQVDQIEPEKLMQYVKGELGILLDLGMLRSLPAADLEGKKLNEETASLCEVVERRSASAGDSLGVIVEVIAPAYVVQGTPNDRVVRKAQVAVSIGQPDATEEDREVAGQNIEEDQK